MPAGLASLGPQLHGLNALKFTSILGRQMNLTLSMGADDRESCMDCKCKRARGCQTVRQSKGMGARGV